MSLVIVYLLVLLGLGENGGGVWAIDMAYIDKIIAQGPYSADWASIERLYQVPDWYIDAKFGFYTHWLVSSVPAFGSEWYPRDMYQPGSNENLHQIATYGPLSPTNGFKEFIPSFDGSAFDPDDWMNLFQRAGAKYAGPVGEHHDGFPMFNCSISPYNAVVMGPKRDVALLLKDAANKLPQKMYFILSSHRAWHFAFYDYGRKWANSDVSQCSCPSWQQSTTVGKTEDDPFYCNLYCPANPNETTPTDSFMVDWLLRTCEMADSYTPDVLYFDWWIGVSPVWQPYLQKMAAFYYNRMVMEGKVGVINTKGTTMPPGTDVLDFERGQACSIQPRYWQTDTSISVKSWGYIQDDIYKSSLSMLQSLVDIVSKNGGLLLNVGPPPNGTIPLAARRSFEEMGDWMGLAGEAIYASRPYHLFSEGPTQVGCGSDDNPLNFTVEDFRFTVQPANQVLNVFCMGAQPGQKVLVKSLGSGRLGQGSVTNVIVFGHTGTLNWQVDSAGLHVILPKNLPLALRHLPVMTVYGMSDLVWDGMVRQGQDASIILYATSADQLNSVFLNVAGIYLTAAGWTTTTTGSIHWTVKVDTGGRFTLGVLAASPDSVLAGVLSTSQGNTVPVVIPQTQSVTQFVLNIVGSVELVPGEVEVVFEGVNKPQQYVMQYEEEIVVGDLSGLQIAYFLLIRSSP